MKQRSSTPKKVLSMAKQKVQNAVQQIKQKVRAQRTVNLYERLIGINPTKKVVVSPAKIRMMRRSIRSSPRRSRSPSRSLSRRQSPLLELVESPKPNVQRKVTRRRSTKKM